MSGQVVRRPARPDELRTLAPIAGRNNCWLCEGAGAYVDVYGVIDGAVYFGDTSVGTVKEVEIVAVHRCECAPLTGRRGASDSTP